MVRTLNRRGNRRGNKRGFTLIEMTLALIVMSVMILASGAILVFLARGQKESADDYDCQARLEIIREIMIADFRPGYTIIAPGTSGGTSTTTVTVQSYDYNASTAVTTQRQYRWVLASGTLTRYVSTYAGGAWGAEASTFSQSGVTSFGITRFNDGDGTASNDKRLDFTLSATQGTQSATLNYTVVIRNIT